MLEVFRENEKRYSILAEQLAKQTEELGLLQNEAREFEKTTRDEMQSTQEACDEIPFLQEFWHIFDLRQSLYLKAV